MRSSQKKSSACGFSQSQLLGTLHSPVHQHHAELDLVGMHQGAAGNGITSGWESSRRLSQLRWGEVLEISQEILDVLEITSELHRKLET